MVFPLLFFSLSAAKADYYLLVTLPWVALWLGIALSQRLARADTLAAACWGASLGLAALGVFAAPVALSAAVSMEGLAVLLAAACALSVAGYQLFLRLPSAFTRELAVLGVAVLSASALVPLLRVADERGARDSSVYLARLIAAHEVPGESVFIYRDFEDVFSTLPFYLGRAVPIVDSGSRDLYFGCSRDDGNACVTPAQLRKARARGPVAVVLLSTRAQDFLAIAGPGLWRAEWVGNKMVMFGGP
jgi:hypothetical protein